ncbi:hypothetical protein ACJRO7_031884 [Eucalyptus globulus]|uniref:Uncharacterized protein n=1 Tax=Eucalyptus globulus TaxID=34317 RepID=A0ABD3JL07_EUCGL
MRRCGRERGAQSGSALAVLNQLTPGVKSRDLFRLFDSRRDLFQLDGVHCYPPRIIGQRVASIILVMSLASSSQLTTMARCCSVNVAACTASDLASPCLAFRLQIHSSNYSGVGLEVVRTRTEAHTGGAGRELC